MFGNEPILEPKGPIPHGDPFLLLPESGVVKMGNTVLVLEDDPSLLMMLSVTLRSSGHEVVLSSDAELALETLPEESPDVILCDVNLPGMKGTEFTEIVKSTPHLADTPAHPQYSRPAQCVVRGPSSMPRWQRVRPGRIRRLPGAL